MTMIERYYRRGREGTWQSVPVLFLAMDAVLTGIMTLVFVYLTHLNVN